MSSASPTDWWRYVEAGLAKHQWSAAQFARRADVDRSLIGRWRDQQVRPTPELARRVAGAFGDAVVAAYLAAGILQHDDIDHIVEVAPFDLGAISTDALFAELRRRVHDFGNTVDIPTDEEIAAHPERYSEGRLSLDEPTKRARRGAAGSSPTG